MLETNRLILRDWKDSDRAPYVALNSDPIVMRFMPSLLSQQETEAFIARASQSIHENGYGRFAVELKQSAEFIGSIGLMKTNFDAPFTPALEIGWRIASPHWNKGYATEGTQAAITHAFGQLHIQQIVAFTPAVNLPSRRVMQKLKMIENPAANFLHPRLPANHPLALHVVYRLNALPQL